MNMFFNNSSCPKLVILTGVLGLSPLGLTAISSLDRPAIAAVEPLQLRANAELAQAPTPNIVGVAQGNPDFSTLVQAAQAAGLADTLAEGGPFTVFAPTNEAFNKLPDGALDFLLQPENRDLLADVLKYHVVPDRVPSSDLQTGGLDTLNGGLAVRVTPDRVIVNDANVIAPDVPASNGIVHGIDRVLIPIAVRDRLAREVPVRGLW